jgi:hypothetical protein
VDRNEQDRAYREQAAREATARELRARTRDSRRHGGSEGDNVRENPGSGTPGDGSSRDGSTQKSDPDGKTAARDEAGAEPKPSKDPPTKRDHKVRDADPPERTNVEVPAGMSGLAKFMLFVLLGLAIFLIARAIYRNLGAPDEAEADEPQDAEGRKKTSTKSVREAEDRATETDVERLLRRAREAAARGDFGSAIDDAYAAMLRNLEGHGQIEVSPWRTNGDYIRDLRDDPPLRSKVREVVREVEPVQFGDTVPDASRFRGVIERVEGIVRPGATFMALLIGAAIGFGCGAPTIAATQGDRGSRSGQHGPLGAAAVLEVLERSGVGARARTHDLDRPGSTRKALLLLEGIILEPEEWDALLAWVHEGGTLIVAAGVDMPGELGVETEISHSGDVYLSGSTHWIHDGRFQVPTGTRLEIDPRASSPRTSVLLRRGPEPADRYDYLYDDLAPTPSSEGEPYAVEIPRGAGEVVVFADGQLFTNASMGVADNAEYVVNFLGQYEQVEFIDELTGAGAANPLEGLLDSRFAPIFLQLLAFMALLFLWRGLPFAKLRDPAVARRRAFVDHIRALSQRYARARASRHVARNYAIWFLDHLADEIGRRNAGSLHQLAQALAVRTGRDEAEVMKLLLAANDLKIGSGSADPSTDFQTIHQLSGLLRQAGFKRSNR